MAFIVAPDGTAFDAERWGLNIEAIEELATQLRRMWLRYHHIFMPQFGHDTSKWAFIYMRALFTMDTKRNYAEIARRIVSIDDDGQSLQQFMSDSPWPTAPLFAQIQNEISRYPQMHGGTLTLDESGDRRSGKFSAGSSKQYLGNIGKVDQGQVGVMLGYYQANTWMMVDAELYLPKIWLNEEHAELRKRWHIPADRIFKTKPQIALEMVKQAKANRLPFQCVVADCVYGCDTELRIGLNDENLLYMGDIRLTTPVYLNRPVVGIPETPPGRRGRRCTIPRVLSDDRPVKPRSLIREMRHQLQTIAVRYTERGLLLMRCAARRVWTVSQDGRVMEEWLFLKQEENGEFKFSLSNAPITATLEELARWRCERYFVERTFQDAKSELGWDELEARKYRAWMHHAALTALALWFAAETKIEWSQRYPRDTGLARELDVAKLPNLSTANIREMLKAVLPLPRLSVEQARRLVVKHLVARSNSTRCRWRKQRTRWQIRDP